MPKIAISGKGGVGKTTLAALLAHILNQQGYTVFAIDADPNATLGLALGFPPDLRASMVPIADMEELIAERTGAQPGVYGGYFRLNPEVSDIPDRFSAQHRGIRLLVMGTVRGAGAGCMCPENVLLRTLVSHLVLQRKEMVILDMVAGLEHLGRGTAAAVDLLVGVVEPGQRSVQTAHAIAGLASDLGLSRYAVVGNKVRDERDQAFIREALNGLPILGFLPYDSQAIEADLTGEAAFDRAPLLVAQAQRIADEALALVTGE
jgi:CO dehydrogenase maturation factor